MVDRNSKSILGFKVGDNSISNAIILIYNLITNNGKLDIEKDKDKLNTITFLCTDGHHAYDAVYNHPLFKGLIEKHIVSKAETSYVESINAALRDGLARLKRKSKAYSKSMDMLILSVELWMYRDMIRANVEKYCIYNGERKYSLKKKELLDNNKEKERKREEENKSFKIVA